MQLVSKLVVGSTLAHFLKRMGKAILNKPTDLSKKKFLTDTIVFSNLRYQIKVKLHKNTNPQTRCVVLTGMRNN